MTLEGIVFKHIFVCKLTWSNCWSTCAKNENWCLNADEAGHHRNRFNSRKKLQRIISQGSVVDLFSASQLYLCNYVCIVSVREEWSHLLRRQVLWYPPSVNSLYIGRKQSFTCSFVETNFCVNLHLNSTRNG